jgi:glucosylceramidase
MTMKPAHLSISAFGLGLLFAACGGSGDPEGTGGGNNGTSGNAGTPSTSGSAGKGATGGSGGGTGGAAMGGGAGTPANGGSSGAAVTGGTGGLGGSAGTVPGAGMGGTGVIAGGSAGMAGSATSGTAGMGAEAGMAGTTGMAGMAGTGSMPVNLPPLVTSASGAYWKTDGTVMDSTASATVTVNDTAGQTWEGFGGAFNELGWKYLTTAEMQAEAIKLLFSAADGANFVWGRIPMGASDYAESRYTNDDMGEDPTAMSGDSNRPAADTGLTKFSIARDQMKLIPYIKAALALRPDLHFWASPWTTPVWMKTGFKTDNGSSGTAVKPSYYDGGTVKNDATNLAAYAELYKKFVTAYKDLGINIELVSPQNEPGYDQNYPSALWDKATYVAWLKVLGPAMSGMGVRVMLGTLSNAGDAGRTDLDISSAVLADSAAKAVVSVVGVQWGVLGKVTEGQTFSGLPIWATEHKCGNYPWESNYNKTQAPNDQAYGVESWGYIRDAINKGKVTSYSAWNMVLDKIGLGIDTSRDWRQDALLVADGGKVNPTPAYYVFRHMSQYAQVNAKVMGTTGGDAVAFKNPDGSIAVTVYNSGAANPSYVVAAGGKKVQFAMPGSGWATVLIKP